MPIEATHVYILMRKDYRVSRNRRAAWYLSHLNQILKFTVKRSWQDLDENAELEVVSVLPSVEREEYRSDRSEGSDDKDNDDDRSNDDNKGSGEDIRGSDVDENDEDGAKDVNGVEPLASEKEFEYYITNQTRVVFLASQYKLVVALDQSPSSAFVDIHTGSVISDSQCEALRKALFGITRPFHVPGTSLTFRPKIYLR